jgi:hypothetical protein
MTEPPAEDAIRRSIEEARQTSAVAEQTLLRDAPIIANPSSVEEVRAALMAPYANKVFMFVVAYCLVVGLIVVGDGFGDGVFHLSDTVLGIIAGSTAVSVIGLIGIVVSGLFGVGRSKS